METDKRTVINTSTPPLNIYRKIASVFVILTVALVFVIFYYALTYAFVTVTPNPEESTYDLNLTVSDQAQEDQEKGIFPGTIINQEMTISDTFQASGTKQLMSGLTGTVEITNTSSKNQPLVKTTRLLTADGVLFRINENVVVPAGGKVQATVYQDNPTQPAIVKTGDKLTVPGLNATSQTLIFATATADFNGTATVQKFITKEDLDKATTDLLNRLQSSVTANASADSLIILKPEIVTKEFSHLADEIFDNFTATLKVQMQGAITPRTPVENFTRRVIESQLSDDKEIISFDKDKTTYTIDFIETDNHKAQIQAHVVAIVIIRKDSQILDRSKMVGLGKEELISYLENFKEIKSADVKFFPFWVSKVPRFPDHIIIEVKPPTP